MRSLVLLIIAIPLYGQTETYDLLTFNPPVGWNKKYDESRITYSASNTAGRWCRMTIYKSVASRGSLKLDFESDWQELVANSFSIRARPDSIALAAPSGWQRKTKGAIWELDHEKSTVILSTMTGFGKEITMIVLTNSTDFNKEITSFLNDFKIRQPENRDGATVPEISIRGTRPVGTWAKQAGVTGKDELGYMQQQYTFDEDGSYTFYSKLFSSRDTVIHFARETGRWIMRGDNLTISPTKSNMELWSKKNQGDKYGDHMNALPLALEKVTYQFVLKYLDDQKQSSLILHAKKTTQRDGQFSDPRRFPDSWIYRPIGTANPKILLPEDQK